ncbi:hypothetical protein BPNPMPFG_002504 [Mesorhizobium sp. AR07]|uniref:hypothetical protein n=1 Tax=Mesorhizobium sp. AR07 TaxID=2865838 RepID=UPI00215DF2C1|nr:hypothetical protein [Mesorhizobium sp. AR07]UVK46794.1 hypothetical protein BPNPMPFG_002504 [Mesorhizobium sp. AR07]
MKKTALLLAFVTLSGFGACNGVPRAVFEPPHQAKIAESLLDECDKPVAIPDRDLSQAEEHALWGKDRRALGNCGYDKHILNQAVRVQQGHTK